jgi:heme exporter protein D
MSFGSFDEFLAMGGHGLYVWMSYAIAVIMFAYNIVSVILRRRRFFRHAIDIERRETAAAGVATVAARAPVSPGGDDAEGESNRS